MTTVAYQGMPGSFSHITSVTLFGKNNVFSGTTSFPEIFSLLSSNKADFGVIPLENSLAGSIHEVYDLIRKNDLHITKEHYLRVRHCLLAYPSETTREQDRLSKIMRVFSHPKALEQCENFFTKNPHIERVIHSDTAGAAKYVSESKDPSIAAIASSQAGELYGLTKLLTGIEDNSENITRFAVIKQKPEEIKDADKCSIIFTLRHIPGSLSRVLSTLASKDLNLTKIESRPIHGKPFEYFFTVDFEFSGASLEYIQEALRIIKLQVAELRVLGLYKAGKLPQLNEL